MKNLSVLLKDLKTFYQKAGRSHLPWRATRDPYKVLVSEVMLQQTQVSRVLPYYERWVKKFPTAKKLADAKLSEVLKEWQGLGYNRRGRYLWEAAKIMHAAKNFEKKSPTTPQLFSRDFFAQLPGVGPYTASALATFAYNEPEAFVETNIRTVFFHYLGGSKKISDAQLLPLVEEALNKSKMQPRDFYWALMDYGAHLKHSGVRLNARSKHYAKQSKFKGSARELRGALVRELLKGPLSIRQLQKNIPRNLAAGELQRELMRLQADGLLIKRRQLFKISE